MTARRDLLAGAIVFALGAAMGLMARGFPSIGAVTYGPDLFPTIVAVGLMASGVGIAVEGFLRTQPTDAAQPAPRPLPVLLVLGIVAFFALALPVLGFHISAAATLFAAVRVFRGGWVTAVVLGAIGPFLLHYVFYNLLRVPLPWGLLTPVAW